jgi:anti-sigma factor RsiW
MSCRDFIAFLDRYLAGEVSAGERARFEHHLAACESCVVYLRTYEETVRLGKAACADPCGPVPTEVPEELVRAVLAARKAGALPGPS